MPGTLIPPWFIPNVPTCDAQSAAGIIWGVSLGLSLFGLIRACQQTFTHWHRTHRVTAYIIFVWLELITSTIIGGLAWGYVHQDIPPSLWYFTGIILLWTFQVHCILQIIITRIALLETSKTLIFRIRWSVFAIILLINLSVACIWVPARLQRSQQYIHVNNVWDRTEKAIIAVVDAGLNIHFIYLVRHSLIAYGLTKYVRLYRVNLFMICISMTMDVLIIAMMSLSNTFLYVCFHPLAYLVKLHIEMTMSELIGKIVKASNHTSWSCACSCGITGPLDISADQNLTVPHIHDFVQHSAQEQRQQQSESQSEPKDPISPTMGRVGRKWPLRRFHRQQLHTPPSIDAVMIPIERPRRLARIDVFRSRRPSWSTWFSNRRDCQRQNSQPHDLEMGTPAASTTVVSQTPTTLTNSCSSKSQAKEEQVDT